ncbi:MAG: poly(3-hydroxybutyrate) depolymerase [Clostridiaceae bacterium]|jgi:poly(3-hydroxybutyrate) depolymerase|nr:poly(3-hydroxybutyrate) depolymerase [Clostridiaceae bacterium]
MKRKVIKPLNKLLVCVAVWLIIILTPMNVFAAQDNNINNLNTSQGMSKNLKDANYIGVTDTDNDLISYRLQVTMKDGKIAKANFYMCFDGCEYTDATSDYLLNNQLMGMKNIQRRARFEAMESTFTNNAKAAKAYNEKLIGLFSPRELSRPSQNKNVYQALQRAWNNIIENQLIVVEHRGEVIGDNENAPHDWNEYVPQYVQEHPGKKVPMVITLHAAENNIEQAEGLGFPYVGAKSGFITVIPASTTPGIWNEPNSKLGVYNDEEFLLKLMNKVENNYSIDSEKIYISGISLGATMAADMGSLHPEIFAGINIFAGGPTLNLDTASSIEKRLSHGPIRLPVIYSVGTDDSINVSKTADNSKPIIREEYDNLFNRFKKMNNIAETDFDENYFFGASLKDNQTFDKYGYTINTGKWYSNDDINRADYMFMCTINDMWHSNPNPYYAEMSWNYLEGFSRKADGTLTHIAK